MSEMVFGMKHIFASTRKRASQGYSNNADTASKRLKALMSYRGVHLCQGDWHFACFQGTLQILAICNLE